MVEEVITPQGISQARRSATRTSTRLITFPDGITRHITLPGWQWAVLDRFDRDSSLVSARKDRRACLRGGAMRPQLSGRAFRTKAPVIIFRSVLPKVFAGLPTTSSVEPTTVSPILARPHSNARSSRVAA